MEPYYNASVDGTGFEGILHYSNSLVDGWLATCFLAFIWIAAVFVMSKGEWKLSNCIGFASLLVFIIGMIFSLFMDVSNYILYISAVLVAISIAMAVKDKFD
jgi:lysylphosphatidylglycerol synthetase-like protein (DUF2156 family)